MKRDQAGIQVTHGMSDDPTIDRAITTITSYSPTEPQIFNTTPLHQHRPPKVCFVKG